MLVKFHTYSGLAGDPDLLMVGVSQDTDERQSAMFNSTGLFSNWRMNRAKKKVLKKFEILTGVPHKEV